MSPTTLIQETEIPSRFILQKRIKQTIGISLLKQEKESTEEPLEVPKNVSELLFNCSDIIPDEQHEKTYFEVFLTSQENQLLKKSSTSRVLSQRTCYMVRHSKLSKVHDPSSLQNSMSSFFEPRENDVEQKTAYTQI